MSAKSLSPLCAIHYIYMLGGVAFGFLMARQGGCGRLRAVGRIWVDSCAAGWAVGGFLRGLFGS